LKLDQRIGVRLKKIFNETIDIYYDLIKLWQNVEWKRFIRSPIDLRMKSSTINEISIDLLEDLIFQGAVSFSDREHTIDIELITPDLSMSDFAGPKVSFSDMEKIKDLGVGGYAVVYLCQLSPYGSVAVKEIKPPSLENLKEQFFREYRREILMHKSLDHPNCVKLLAICTSPLCIISEYVSGGNLFELLVDWNTHITWVNIITISKNMALGLKYMHSLFIAHLDFKSPNILIENDKGDIVAKITDFGTARYFNVPISGRRVDNPIWLAPEILLNEDYDQRVDIYSYGIILFELMTRKRPFADIKFLSTIQDKIVAGDRPTFTKSSYPDDFVHILTKCWDQSKEKRPDFNWIIKRIEKLEKKVEEYESTYGHRMKKKIKKKIKSIKREKKVKEIKEEPIKSSPEKELVKSQDKGRKSFRVVPTRERAPSKKFSKSQLTNNTNV